MPNEQGVIRRLLVKACPQFLEDWLGAAGARFNRGIEAVSDYTRDHVQIGEKLEAAPDMLWRAAKGATSAQHAKAEADYAKAETDRMDAELRRRTLEAKTRHECADADKAEAEARIAKIREMQARIELVKQLKEIGVSASLDSGLSISVSPAPLLLGDPTSPTAVISSEEKDEMRTSLVKVIFQPGREDADNFMIDSWSCAEGDRIFASFPVCEVSAMIATSPAYRTLLQVQSSVGGTVLELLVAAGKPIKPGDILALILPN
jgi:multidrug efflux pump subunit AcrA (membrane-fusion protein)